MDLFVGKSIQTRLQKYPNDFILFQKAVAILSAASLAMAVSLAVTDKNSASAKNAKTSLQNVQFDRVSPTQTSAQAPAKTSSLVKG